MIELDDAMAGAAEQSQSEAADWIERVTDASSDFECVGLEAASGIGL